VNCVTHGADAESEHEACEIEAGDRGIGRPKAECREQTCAGERIVSRLGGAAALASAARICKGFLRPRGIRDAVDLLRFTLAYCLGERGLRATAAWAAASGLADISNPAILCGLRHCGDWLTVLIGQLLGASTPTPAHGRLIRLIDRVQHRRDAVRLQVDVS
jgi:hypothetical protein